MSAEGVPIQRLGELGTFTRGSGLQKADFAESGVGCIHYGQLYTHYGAKAYTTKSFVAPDLAARLRRAKTGDLIIATTSENEADLARAVAWLGADEIAVSGDAYIYSHSLDPTYASYLFQTASFHSQKDRSITGTKVKRISGDALASIRVPVPPIEVQREIVAILDTFTELEADLEAELEARRRQYAHFAHALLAPTRSPESDLRTLGDIAEFKYGYTATAQERGELRFLRITDISPGGKLLAGGAKFVPASPEALPFTVKRGDLLMARTGGTFGKTMLFEGDEPAVFASFLIRIRFPGGDLLPSYYWHFAQSNHFWDQANALATAGGQPQFNANALQLVRVPVPSIEDQHRIVAQLDALDALVNDLTRGLPAELAARRKQYEYYRDKLLTFPEAS